jgi:hypothetical protein
MFRGGAFHDMKAVVTYINTFSRPLWFKKLVWHWRPSENQLDWICEPVKQAVAETK